MALLVRVWGIVTLADGETKVGHIERGDLVFNPSVDDMEVEATLATQTAARLAEEVVERLGERLTDWGRTINRMVTDDEKRECPHCGHPAAIHSDEREHDFGCFAPGCGCTSWPPSERTG